MESCDLLIIGGGPAGSSFSWKLRKSGLDVLILDKSEFPRDKVCAGWVTPAVISTLQIDEEEYCKNRVFQPIIGFLTSMLNGPEVETRYGNTVSYGIRRSEFDHYLLERSGARLKLGEPFKSLRRENGHWIVNDWIKAPLVIGAGGHFCPVARFVGANSKKDETAVIAQEIEFKMDERQQAECSVRSDTPELFFCEDLKGYGWCVRKGNFLNIGLGREDNQNLSGHVRLFYDYLLQKGKIPRNAPTNFKGHAYLLYRHASRKLLDDGIMLIGDAAGLAYPQSGEGIRPAIESALIASGVVLSANGDYQASSLQPYLELLEKRFGKGDSGSILNILPEGLVQLAAKKLMSSKWFSRKILIERWFLHVHQPPLN